MQYLFKSNFRKFTVVLALTLLTFLSLQTSFVRVFLIDDSLAAAGYRYAFPSDVCKTGARNVEDIFGSNLEGQNVPFSRIKITKSDTNIYAFMSGVVTKVEKINGKVSLWLSGDDGYNYYYGDLSEVKVTEEAVKVGDLIGKAESGYIYFAVTRGGYQTEMTSGGLREKGYFRSNPYQTERGIKTLIFKNGTVEFLNPTPIINSSIVIRQCSETPNPTVSLGDVTQESNNNSVTLRATIADPGKKNVTVEFRIRRVGEEADQTLQVSDIHTNVWPPAKWKGSGSRFEYTFRGLEPGVYEWSARGMNENGVYSHGVTFGLESSRGEKVSYNTVLAQSAATQTTSDGYAPLQLVTVADPSASVSDETVYQDSFPDPGLKVGSDSISECCYAVVPSEGTFGMAPRSGTYKVAILSYIPGSDRGNRKVSVWEGADNATKKNIYETTAWYNDFNEFRFDLDSDNAAFQAPSDGVSNKLRFRIDNDPLKADPRDSTFFIKSIRIVRVASSVTTTTIPSVTTAPTTTQPVTTTSPTTTVTTPTPSTSSICPLSFDRNKQSVYESSGETDPCSTGRPAGAGSCYIKTYCQNINWVKGSEGKSIAESIGALGQSNGIAGDREAVDNVIRSEIYMQFGDLSSQNRALAQKVILSYAFLESNSYYKFFEGSGTPRYYCDSSKVGCCLDFFSLTSDKFCTKKKRAAASYDIKYATYLAVKEFRGAYLSVKPTTLDGWKTVAERVFGGSFWNKSWGYSPNHAAYLTSGKYANEQPYSCEKPNNPPTISTTDVSTSSDMVQLGTGLSNVTLKAVAPDPDGNQTSVKFRIYKYDTAGLTSEQYCSTMKESGDFDALKPSGEVHSYTFTGLEPGTYKWSAIARDEKYRKSEGGSMFCFSSGDPTKPLYGFAYPKTFTVTQSGTVEINHRPYIKPAEMAATPNTDGASVSLTSKGYDDDADKVQLYYRVREKVTGNCVVGSGISIFSDSGWTEAKAGGSPFPVTISGLKPGMAYQWSVKAQDEHGLTSKYTADPQAGLSFCGGSEWYPSLEFTTASSGTTTTTSSTSTTVGSNPSCSFSATSFGFTVGSPVNLTYGTQNAVSAEICSAGGSCKDTPVGLNQVFVANPTGDTVYTMTVKNAAGTTGTCKTSVTPSSTTTTGGGQGFTLVKNWEYCKDSSYPADCGLITVSSGAIPIFDPGALDGSHKMNAVFGDGVGTLVEAPTGGYSLGAGTYEVRVRATAENITTPRSLSVETVGGTVIKKVDIAPTGTTSALQYGEYKMQFTLTDTRTVLFRFRNNSIGRVFFDRISLYKQ